MSTPITERKSLKDLRESTATLFAQNHTPMKITCNTDKVSFEMDPHEIRVMPKECLNEPGFIRLWARNSVTISDDPEMENQLTLSAGGVVEGLRTVYSVDKDGNQIEVTPQMQAPPSDRDIVVGTVDAPEGAVNYGQANNTLCLIGGTACPPVFRTAKQLEAGVPPLCGHHEGDAARVMSTPQPDGTWTHQLTRVSIQETKKTQ